MCMSSHRSRVTRKWHIPWPDYPMFPIVWGNSFPVHIGQLGCTAYASWNYEGDGKQWLNVLYSGRWTGSLGPIASPDLTPMDFFLWGQLKDHVNAVPPRTIEDIVARRQVVVTVVIGSVLCARECCASHRRLPRNGRSPLRTPILTSRRRWFYHLIVCLIWHWCVSWKLNVTGHIFYFRRVFLNKEPRQSL
jgi:hypothetical protein